MPPSTSQSLTAPSSTTLRGFWLHFVCASVTLVLGMWCSSGTLSPYAATHYQPTVLEPCGYLANLDHGNFLGTFLFLDGAPRESWLWSVYLRRILYPLISYPLMKVYGFVIGGFLTNVVVHLGSVWLFCAWLLRRYGQKSAVAALWLLATYPGITYWAGLPYNQDMIVPCSLLSMMLLFAIHEASSWRTVVCASALIGFLCLGYDLLPFFGVASVLIVLFTKRRGWLFSPLVVCVLLAPLALVLGIEHYGYGISLSNANNDQYAQLFSAYFSPIDLSAWWALVRAVPEVAWHTYFYSNFVVLPVLFALTLALGWSSGIRPSLVESVVFAAIGLVFLFNNLSPPYQGWQMRGLWIPRIYQPLFVVFIIYFARAVASPYMSARRKPVVLLLLVGAVLSNALIVFGPITAHPALADRVYYNFYRHSYPGILTKNLETYGRRPLGFCTKQKSDRSSQRAFEARQPAI